MKGEKTIIQKLVSLLAVLALLAACGGGGADFVIANESEPQSLDPHLIEGVPELRLNLALFEGLMAYDPKTAEPVPGLAESWTVSEDGTVYTFRLRQAVWSDGVPITAETVVKSWLRVLDPKTAAPYAWFPAAFLQGGRTSSTARQDPRL